DYPRSSLVRGALLIAPHGVEAGDEVGRRYHRRAGAPHHLDDSGWNPIEVRNGVTGRILHRDALSLDQAAEQRFESAPAAVLLLAPGAGPIDPGTLLDVVRDRDWRAVTRYIDEE